MEEKMKELEKRIADLEEQVQNQPKKLAEALRNIKTDHEVSAQEQLTKKDLYCIAKHLQIFTKKYYHEQDISDSAICENCSHIKECTQNYSKVCDPYPSLIKIANMADLKISEFKTNYSLST